MKSTNEANWISIAVGFICLVLAISAGIRLGSIISTIGAWRAVADTLVAGIFIAVVGVVVSIVLNSLYDD